MVTDDTVSTRVATYDGDASHMIGIMFGPDAMGRHWKVTEVAHDAETDTSRVTFTPPDQGDIARVLVELARQQGITERDVRRAERIERNHR